MTEGNRYMLITSDKALDAVNDMLAALGEAPVNTLEASQNVDVANAIKVLDNINKQVQSKGWSFNTIRELTLNPDIRNSNKIKWQDDFLYIVGKDGTKYVQKGDYLYDFDRQSYTFTNPIRVEVIREVDFEYMPVPVRNYIVARATRIFQMQTLGDGELNQHLAQEEQNAWLELQEYDMELNDYSMYDLRNVREIMRR